MKKYIVIAITFLFLGTAYMGTQNLNLPFLHHSSVPVVSAAASDYLLEIDGIDGESTTVPKAIELQSWSWGETNSAGHGGGGGLGAGKVNMQDFHFTMSSSKASPKLMLAVASGQHIKQVVLTARKAGGEGQQQPFLTITLSDVLVSSYQVSGNGSDPVPTDEITINFSKIEFSYRAQKPDGSLDAPVTTGWDLAQNKKI